MNERQRDAARADAEEWAANEYGPTLTIGEYRKIQAAWIEATRRALTQSRVNELVANAGAIARHTFDTHAPAIARTMEEHVAAGEGRN